MMYEGQDRYVSGSNETSAAGIRNRRSAKAFLAAAGIVIGVAIVVIVLYLIFQPEEKTTTLPGVEDAQLVFTSPTDAEQQVSVRQLTGYDWAVLLNTPLDDKRAVLSVPYLATLQLETAIQQRELLNSSQRYVGAEAVQLLKNGSSLKNILENLAVLEDEYYRLGLPSGVVHAERLRHLARRLESYNPPSGEIRDSETKQFVQDHLGFSVDTFEGWYALIGFRYGQLVQRIEKTKDKKSVLTVEEYLGANQQRRDVLPR